MIRRTVFQHIEHASQVLILNGFVPRHLQRSFHRSILSHLPPTSVTMDCTDRYTSDKIELSRIGSSIPSRRVASDKYSRLVVTQSELTAEVIRKLLNNQICAIVIPNYIKSHVCQKLSSFFCHHPLRSKYTHEYIDDISGERKMEYYGVDRVGIPFNSVYGTDVNSEQRRHYYDMAQRNMNMIREACEPYLTPTDKLRLQLDETWPSGAKIAQFSPEKRKMFIGIARIMSARYSKLSEEQPHFDYLPRQEFELEKQLAANIYLSVPDRHGELELWDVPECSPEDPMPENWRSKLPESILIQPKVGDLIIMNPRRPHAIRAFEGETDRVSMQCFIGYKSHTEPLMMWN